MFARIMIIFYLSFLISQNNSFLKEISSNKSSFSCYYPIKYREIENKDLIDSFQSKKVEEYFNDGFSDKEIMDDLHKKDYHIYYRRESYFLPEQCINKQRFFNVYNFEQSGFSSPDIDNYYDMNIFSSKLELKNGEYVYEDKIIPNMGFIIATSAPIGNIEDLINTPEFKRVCGNDYAENKSEVCLSGNNKIDGKYIKENTILNFYKNLKFHNIDYIIMLTNLYEKLNYPNCVCTIKADKYFNFEDNETFKILNNDHLTDSGFTVTSVRNNQELLKIIKSNEYFGEEINDIIELRQLIIRNNKGEIFHTVNHLYFKKWNDHGVPKGKSKKILFGMVDYVREKLNQNKNVLIHCTRGKGRTGTFIVSILISNLIRSEKLNFFKLIFELRKNRPGLIKNENQLALIRKKMAKSSLN